MSTHTKTAAKFENCDECKPGNPCFNNYDEVCLKSDLRKTAPRAESKTPEWALKAAQEIFASSHRDSYTVNHSAAIIARHAPGAAGDADSERIAFILANCEVTLHGEPIGSLEELDNFMHGQSAPPTATTQQEGRA